MNDWYEACISFLALMWYGYAIIMGFSLLFESEELVDVFIAIFCTWVLMALPAIIRGKW